MPTSSQAEAEKSSLSPSIICANPSWEIVKSMAYLPNSISQRQVLISYLDPFPSPSHDKGSTKCDYLLIFAFLHDLTPDNGRRIYIKIAKTWKFFFLVTEEESRFR